MTASSCTRWTMCRSCWASGGMADSRGCMSIDAEPEVEEAEVEDLNSSEPALADVKLAQRMGGGLIWASSRTRPDIAYAVSRLSSAATKAEVGNAAREAGAAVFGRHA